MSLSRLSFLAALSLALGASAEVRWTYENGVLTEIASATSGTTLWSFKLSNKGVLTKNVTGNGSQLDFRKAAMPEGAPDIVQFSGRGLFNERGTDVKEIFMPETLTTISDLPFIRCFGLTNLVWSANVTSIGELAFRECTALKSEVVIPPKMTAIVYDSFDNCTSVGSLRLHDKLTSICASAFNYWQGLTNVVGGLVPRSVTSIGNSAFNQCFKLANPFEWGFLTDENGEPVEISVADGSTILNKCRAVPSIRLGPGFTRFPYHLITEPYGLKYVEMGENISSCWETFVGAPLTNVVIKYAGTFAFPEEAGSRSSPYNTFKDVTTLKEISFGGWFSYAANAAYNPFSGWTDLQARFVVDGSNATCQAFCADETKLTPWIKVPVEDQLAYFVRYGEDAKVPCGVTVAVANGLPRTYIVRRGDFDWDLPKIVYPLDDDCVQGMDASTVHYEVGDRHVYVITNTSMDVQLLTKQPLTLVEALVVGGGGAGAALKGGGGGGGGVVDDTIPRLVDAGTLFTIKVGKGGVGTTTRFTAAKGEATTLSFAGNEFTAFGGGGGGSDKQSGWMPSQGGDIGSGGGTGSGGSIAHKDGDDYTESQGNPGGNSNGGVGGGGGFSEPGENGVPGKSGRGGEGLTNSITGVSKVYGSGGGGGAGNPNTGTVGAGGEGKGGTNAGDGAPYVAGAAGCDAPAGFGGGGGGGGYVNPTTTRGGNGGSGVVILAFTVGGKAGQPAVREEDIVIGHDGDTTLPSVSVTMGSTEPNMTYAATVRISCGTGALAQAGTAYDCVREFSSVTNGQVLAFLADFYPAAGEQVYVKVEATAVGADDISASAEKPAEGTVPAFVGHGGGAHVIHVRLGAKGKADGTSWADAYTDFREALKKLDVVRPELWFCGSDTTDAFTTMITLDAAAVIRGGFMGMEDCVAERPEGSRSVITSADNHDCLTFANSKSLTVDGFFLTKGYSHGLVKSGEGDITVTNCVFDGNGTCDIGTGGAISGRSLYIAGSSSSTTATVVDCVIARSYERGTSGGAGALSLSSLKQAWVTGCLFVSNGLAFGTSPFGVHNGRSGCWGAALAVNATPVTVERCEFRGNVALSGYVSSADCGGLVNLRGNCGESGFRNCAWVGNEVLYTHAFTDSGKDYEGGVLVVDVTDDSTVAVENCTFAGNLYEGHFSTAGLNVRTGTANVKDSIFFANFSGNTCGDISPADLRVQTNATAHVTYTMFGGETNRLADAGGTLDIGVGCVDGDPLFATATNVYADCRAKSGGHYYYTAASAPTLIAADVHEQKRSPAIDAGDPRSDCLNEPKPNGRRVNLGAYGNTPEAMTSKQGLMLFVR